MRSRLLFALSALIPAALKAAPLATLSLTMPLCAGDGHWRSVTVPHDQDGTPPPSAACCAKGCRSGPRKRGARIDPAQ
jgi:hypothetical protein